MSTAHLVARALRARQTVTWRHVSERYARGFGTLTRAQILRLVREVIGDESTPYRFSTQIQTVTK
jgi:hypothetical protein